MKKIFKKIIAMDHVNQTVFYNAIFNKEDNHEKDFFYILKKFDSDFLDEYFKSMPQHVSGWMKDELKKISNVSDEAYKIACENIKKIFNAQNDNKLAMENKVKECNKKAGSQRSFLKAKAELAISDQMLGKTMPMPQKSVSKDSKIITLPKEFSTLLKETNILNCIQNRMSHRKFSDTPLLLEELAYLLWATQGVRKVLYEGKGSFRTVPSAGSRHPFETYLAVVNVSGLKQGIYRYLPFSHELVFLKEVENIKETLIFANHGQRFAGECAVCFIWTCIPYRTEWRYSFHSHKAILLDAGHVCQNLYLACESIEAGTCAIGAYQQDEMDKLIGVDSIEEMTVYVSPVGKIK